ncbi:hypothetical protein [Janthinobacterium agaricidamnosum]|uniref:hypothetical protein n=1 Tax=Janthinobacterium agaricidamnosum TaxID=55508 RepID=UPI00056DC286|nr:hypothetical protein [Janthinobacterium agaricidamnosum]
MKNCFFGVTFMLLMVNASACKFAARSLEQRVAGAEEIFIANLLESKVMPIDDRHKWPWREGRFQVKQTLKGGEQPEEIMLATGLGGGDCGVRMMVLRNYVIFKGRQDTDIADPSGTRVIEDVEVEELTEKIQSIMCQQQHGES